MKISNLQKARYQYTPKLPSILEAPLENIGIKTGATTESVSDQTDLKRLFSTTYGRPVAEFVKGENPNASREVRIGVVLSGGQAPGGHNVIAGLFDAVKKGNPNSTVLGFLGGPSGILDNQTIEITPKFIDPYRNTGGFDMIGSGRTKIESDEQIEKALVTCSTLSLTAIAEQCGYQDMSAFRRLIRRHTGRPPGEHRRAHSVRAELRS